MKLLTNLIVLIVIFLSCSSLDNQLNFYDLEVYKEFRNENFEKALTLSFELKNQYPENQFYQFHTDFLIGQIYYTLGNFEEAIPYLKAITDIREYPWSKIYRNLTDADLTTFRSDASLFLAKIYLEKNDYHESLKYTKKAETQFDYFSCGTDALMKMDDIRNCYLENYFGLKEVPNILSIIGDKVFWYKKDSDYIERLVEVIQSQYTNEKIRENFEMALTRIKAVPSSHEDIVLFDSIFQREVIHNFDYKTIIFETEVNISIGFFIFDEFLEKIKEFEHENKLISSEIEMVEFCKYLIKDSGLFKALSQN